jgi:homoserine kinase
VIIEPIRSILIPKFDEIKTKSLQLGALGGGISGSGPSVFMLAEKEETAQHIAKMMKAVYDEIKIDSFVYVSKINPTGIEIINENEGNKPLN